MRHVDVTAKVPELVREHPPWDVFVRLGNLTKLRAVAEGTFVPVNYESGLLLYALVRGFRPRRILEVGTGRGFGCLSMALALLDGGIDGHVVTVDTRAYDEPQDWALDDGSGPRIARLSRRDVWERHVDARLRERVIQMQDSSVRALRTLVDSQEFGADLVYIDGDHTYPVVRHDFYASLLVARPPFRILLDDYTPRSHLYGVRRLVDREIDPVFEAEAIHTDGRWYGQPGAAVPMELSDQAQVLVDSDKVRRPLEDVFPRERVARIVRFHQRWPRALTKADALRAVASERLSRLFRPRRGGETAC